MSTNDWSEETAYRQIEVRDAIYQMLQSLS